MSISLSEEIRSGKRRLLLAFNPHSSRFNLVQEQVLSKLDVAGLNYSIIEVQQASLEDNVKRLKSRIKPGDIVLSAAGDGSAHAVAHSVIAAAQPNVSLGFLAYGNFNDLPKALNTRSVQRDPVAFLDKVHEQVIYPLEVIANDKSLRKALLYATVGWTAQAAARFDDPKLRKSFIGGRAGVLKSLWHLGLYYLGSKQNSRLPSFKLNKKRFDKSSDVLFMNGPTLARLFKVGKSRMGKRRFLYRVLDVRGLIKNVPFLTLGVLSHIKGQESSRVELTFDEKADFKLQCDGEVVSLKDISNIIVQKSTNSLTVLTNK